MLVWIPNSYLVDLKTVITFVTEVEITADSSEQCSLTIGRLLKIIHYSIACAYDQHNSPQPATHIWVMNSLSDLIDASEDRLLQRKESAPQSSL